ncbi:MAG TPA: endolytic transglycosylase MltG [Pilimelia sp.]|nr:endolytic transglycosylase MltG [Pilimelia sp.]
MIDELELAFDEPADRGRHRHRRSARKKRGGGGGKSVLALLVVLVLLGGLAGGAWYGFDKVQGFFNTPDYSGGGTGEVIVQVKPGETATEIANTLVSADVVKSAAAFIEAASANTRSKNIQPGYYKLRRQMRAADAVTLLLDLRNKVSTKVTIREGLTTKQTLAALSKATKIPVKDFEAAAKDPVALGVPGFWFKRDDGKKVIRSIEGFLFPQTYEFDPGSKAPQILQQMVRQFVAVTQNIKFVERVQAERKISPYEALIVASMAQAEAGNPDDLGKVARVAYNRVYSNTFPCSCLQFDVTVNYYWELTGKPTKASKNMSQEELYDASNPYSTHAHPGLTPTPINNPGQQALEGAMAPPAGKWLYFVAIDKQGHSAFATTLDEHNRNIAKARQNGVL